MTQDKLTALRNRLMENEFSRMNNMQREAVFTTKGPVLILAGAGSGKTTVLVNRIANLVSWGSAYNSSYFKEPLTDEELTEIELAVNNKTELREELKKKLYVSPAKPWQILAITFTNKAAGELKERIIARIPEATDIWASTFHSTCARILRRYGERLGYTSKFTVYDTDDQRRQMKEILKAMNVDEKVLPHRSVLTEISRAKDQLKSPEDFKQETMSDSRRITIAKAYAMYAKRLKDSDAMDFDDLIYNTVKLFEENKDVLEYYQNLFKYIMVDEYQDTNMAQYRLISMLAEKNRNICVVGDDDQSIYKFRGATIENILSFEKNYPDGKVIRLEQNYRSTKTILNAANSVIAHNEERKGKTLWTDNPEGDKIVVHTARDERDEAKYISENILEQVANGRKFSDFAVLYRTNAQSNIIEQNMARSGIPHRLIGGHRFYDREEIKDMTSYLQVINNPSDNIRLRRIINKPKRSIGNATVEKASEIADVMGESLYYVISHAEDYEPLKRSVAKLKEFTNLIDSLIEYSEDEDTTICQLYNEILKRTDYINLLKKENEDKESRDKRMARVENISELMTNIKNYEDDNPEEATLSGFLEDIALLSDIDNYNSDSDSVVLMTLHSAKGLEFPVVFIPGAEEGIFPGIQSIMNPTQIPEERRLAYVGITRAKEKLHIIRANERTMYGSTSYNRISRFVNEIPTELAQITSAVVETSFTSPARASTGVQRTTGTAQGNSGYLNSTFANRTYQPQSKPAQSGVSFKAGDQVMHKAFGKGMIISAKPMANDTYLEIAFDKVGTKKLMANFAKLEKI
ncbi:MAG: UvrD-helicase domain-containing protein [Clostridia bacterium]|nr:UvrD-helicase domain-containing protein [Clostridia bacterium]